jgi:hypothetical protein
LRRGARHPSLVDPAEGARRREAIARRRGERLLPRRGNEPLLAPLLIGDAGDRERASAQRLEALAGRS